jgi:serine/threonine protein kinase
MVMPMCTLSYAAPETVIAIMDPDVRPQLADVAVDVWSLGVMAYECMTNTRVLPNECGRQSVIACARGDAPYPWERPRDQQHPKWASSNARQALELCLARDPAHRPDARRLHQSLSSLGSSLHRE